MPDWFAVILWRDSEAEAAGWFPRAVDFVLFSCRTRPNRAHLLRSHRSSWALSSSYWDPKYLGRVQVLEEASEMAAEA